MRFSLLNLRIILLAVYLVSVVLYVYADESNSNPTEKKETEEGENNNDESKHTNRDSDVVSELNVSDVGMRLSDWEQTESDGGDEGDQKDSISNIDISDAKINNEDEVELSRKSNRVKIYLENNYYSSHREGIKILLSQRLIVHRQQKLFI